MTYDYVLPLVLSTETSQRYYLLLDSATANPSHANGATRIASNQVRDYELPFPPCQLTKDHCRQHLMRFKKKPSALNPSISEKLAALEALKKSLLHQAFSGQSIGPAS